MVTKMEKLPDNYIRCIWCGSANRLESNGFPPNKCFNCQLNPMPGEDPTKGGKVDPKKAAKSDRNKRGAAKTGRLDLVGIGEPIIGVDPGARYTGVVVRDGDAVLHASTLVRPKTLDSGTEWALMVVTEIQTILKDFPTLMPMGVEGISDPKGFHKGQRAAINPKDIIRAGIVLGAVVATWPKSIIVPPGGNGSQHYSHYPAVLIGARPKDLPGSNNKAGTRGHEQSAYDVAGKAAKDGYPRDTPLLIVK
jgi:hypothetical protein